MCGIAGFIHSDPARPAVAAPFCRPRPLALRPQERYTEHRAFPPEHSPEPRRPVPAMPTFDPSLLELFRAELEVHLPALDEGLLALEKELAGAYQRSLVGARLEVLVEGADPQHPGGPPEGDPV